MGTLFGLLCFYALLRFGMYNIMRSAARQPRSIHLFGGLCVAFVAGIVLLATAAPYLDTERYDVAAYVAMTTLLATAVVGWIATK